MKSKLTFKHDQVDINNPYLSMCGKYAVEPTIYGFEQSAIGLSRVYVRPAGDGSSDSLVIAGYAEGVPEPVRGVLYEKDFEGALVIDDAPEPALWHEALIVRVNADGFVTAHMRLCDLGR